MKFKRLASVVVAFGLTGGALAQAAAPAHAADAAPQTQAAATTPAPQPQTFAMGAKESPEHVDATKTARAYQDVLPTSTNLTQYAVPVGYQGTIGSCVTWAIDYAMLGWYAKRAGIPTGTSFAPMYTYSQIHLTNEPDGGGSYPWAALNVAQNQGNDTEPHYSHDGYNDFQNLPTAADKANAANYKIAGYDTLFNGVSQVAGSKTQRVKEGLAAGKPVAVAFYVRDGFRQLWNNHSSTATDNDTTSPVLGGHEVLALGYDQYGLLIQNSWGTGWGYNGYGHLSWNVVEKDLNHAATIRGFASNPSTDTVKPVATAPVQTMASGTVMSNGNAPVTIRWSATDNVGVTGYELYASTNGGAWTKQTLASAMSTSKAFVLTPGNTYRFTAHARDAAGNWSDYKYGPLFKVNNFNEVSSNITYVGKWTRAAWASANGGYLALTAQAGASASMTYTGRNAAWIASKATNRGQVNVYLDGVFQRTVDLYSATTKAQAVGIAVNSTVSGTHTLKIVAVGTSGRPSVDVDSLIVFS